MATYPSVFAWKIPWTEEPGRMQPRRLQTLSIAEAAQHRHTQRSPPQSVSAFIGNTRAFSERLHRIALPPAGSECFRPHPHQCSVFSDF